MPQAALYARVSTNDQTCANQRRLLEAWAEARTSEYRFYVDEGWSGTREDRPAFQEMLGDLRAGKLSAVVAVRADRLSRSVMQFATLAEVCVQHGADLILTEQGGSLGDTPHGRLMLNMLAAFAQFERDLISERTKEGMARAKAQGIHVGRPTILDTDETAADLVRRIVEARPAYAFANYALSTALEKEGVKITPEALKRWLKQEGYCDDNE